MTLHQFRELMDVHAESERVRDYRAGIVAAVIANANRATDARTVRPEDFFVSLREPAKHLDGPQAEALVSIMRCWAEDWNARGTAEA